MNKTYTVQRQLLLRARFRKAKRWIFPQGPLAYYCNDLVINQIHVMYRLRAAMIKKKTLTSFAWCSCYTLCITKTPPPNLSWTSRTTNLKIVGSIPGWIASYVAKPHSSSVSKWQISNYGLILFMTHRNTGVTSGHYTRITDMLYHQNEKEVLRNIKTVFPCITPTIA